MNNKRGQAAMEFLMTYGWAILAAIIAIGVLAYFGVFSPGKYVTGSAVSNPPYYINAWNVKEGNPGIVNLQLRNNGGEDYNVTSVLVSNTDVDCATTSVPGTITAGQTLTINVPCDTVLTAGQTFKGDLTIKYTKLGTLNPLELTSTGTVAEKITA